MEDLISRKALYEKIAKLEEEARKRLLKTPRNADEFLIHKVQFNEISNLKNEIMDTPTVEAVPKSYADQIRWERDIAIEQLNEIGCGFGQKMDEVKEKLESLQWNFCNENFSDGCDDAELEVLVYTEEKYIEAEFKEVGFALYYPGEKKFRSVYNHHADITENVVAWMHKPKPYKGE